MTTELAAGAVPLLHDFLSASARRAPDKVALVCGARRVTFGKLERESNALAHALEHRGVARGDRVIVFADNTVETVVAFWAALKANAVVSIVNPLTKTAKLEYLIDDCAPAALVTDAHLAHVWSGPAASPHLKTVIVSGTIEDSALAHLPRAVRWNDALAEGNPGEPPARRNIDVDLAAIIYTSGSTGDAKGVMLSHRNMLTAARSVSTYLGYREDDVVLDMLPLAFDYGLYQMIMSARVGARLVLERSFAFPARTLELLGRERITVFPGVPTIFAIMAGMDNLAAFDLASVRVVTNTAAALPQKHIDFLRRTFPAARVFSMYGLTECKRCTYLPPEDLDRKPGSVGLAIPNTELWLVDDKGARVPPGVVGELVIRGATVMQGYWGKPDATAEKLKPGPLPGERVLHTGDYCRLDEDGYLYFVARMDDVIKCRGEKVAPKEVETVLYDIPGVREAAVIGVEDAILGQAVKAFVVLEPGTVMTEREIQRHCLAKLENFMVPKTVAIVPDLPKTDTGKIRKTGARVSDAPNVHDLRDVRDALRAGRVRFMDVEILVAEGALVPRPETELLGETAVELLRAAGASRPRVIDMCCGAGNLACAIAHRLPDARVWASDLTADCVALARRNVDALGLTDRVSVYEGDLFAPFADLSLDGGIDAVVCNPPYISDKRLGSDRAHLLEHEPREAFAAGPFGLSIHMRVAKDAVRYLRPGGVLLFEIGLGQERQVETLFQRARAYEDIRAVCNAAGEARVVTGRKA